MMRSPVEGRRLPRDEEEAAAFKGLGHAIAVIRERCGMDRDALADKAEMARPQLEKIERGEVDEWWGGLRMIAEALGMPLPALMMEAEEFAPARAGESLRQSVGEAEGESAIPGTWSEATEGKARKKPDAGSRG